MPMAMFMMEQRIRITKSDEPKTVGRKGTVVKINNDGSALVRMDGDRGVKITGKTLWPEDCEPYYK
jgi:RNase P/RNase MRP subunit p29